jgi:hypothetical protein
MTALRMQFLTLAVIFLVGMFLTGFDQVHWFMWVPVVLLVFAAITGICPGLMLWQKLGLK